MKCKQLRPGFELVVAVYTSFDDNHYATRLQREKKKQSFNGDVNKKFKS